MKTISKTILLLLFAVLVQRASANISIPEIFSDNMVLQQKSEVAFWGWAKAGETVTIKPDWLDNPVSVKVGPSGRWKLSLNTPAAGGPFNISLKGYNEIQLKNVMIGEVWLCSGQSNMEWTPRSGINNAEEEIKNANSPKIRLFTVFNASSANPQEHFTGEWVECTPETMQSFSAIGYFFGRKISDELNVPVGIINSSWGGTPAEAWMPEELFDKDSFLNEAASKQKPVPWGPVEKAVLYNAMISPLVPFRIAGVLWYQGEANTINACAYKELLSSLIKGWRNLWGYEFPFYYAQIAPYQYGNPNEGVLVRDAQRRVLDVPNTGMIVLSDIGDTTNIHPKNKKDAALRFASLALNRYYKTIQSEDSGPLFSGMTIEKNKAIISFDHSEGLHTLKGDPDYFEIAGADGIFFPAKAKIKDQKVILQSDKVKVPVKARFAWKNTATPNLLNGAGLPASCFTTESCTHN
ncbi:MAG TPA: sialate O-acetylesterase [Bacteroidales bacterium]|nr:sialate O-acetylesterase [Bacteroidales bacterium]